jgi:Protein of unknown function (DUF3108)
MSIRTVAAVALLAPALAVMAATPPAPHSIAASYNVIRNGTHVGVMQELFEAADGRYRIVSDTHAVGLLVLLAPHPLRVTSSGRLTGAGLTPLHFEGRRGDNDPRQVRVDFDWETKQMKVVRSGRNEVQPLPPGIQDQLSIMYQFMFLAPDGSRDLHLTRTTGRRLERHHYTVRTDVEIDTPIGRMTTVHLVRQHTPEESGVEIWLAPQHRYLPLKMLILDDDGTRYEQLITKLEIKP